MARHTDNATGNHSLTWCFGMFAWNIAAYALMYSLLADPKVSASQPAAQTTSHSTHVPASTPTPR